MSQHTNRSFLYGDGLFETMRCLNGRIAFLAEHFERLSHGMQTLGMLAPQDFSPKWMEKQILEEIDKNAMHANAPNWRVRMTVFRAEGGLYTPQHNQVEWTIACSPLASSAYQLNEKGLLVGKYKEVRLSADILSPLKTTSALPYVMAGLYRKTEHPEWDDCLLINSEGRFVEAIAANFFLRIGERLYTPALAEGPVSGVLRRVLMDWCLQHHIEVEECALTATHFQEADEIWLTNAIQGIRWVQELSFVPGRVYHRDWADRVVSGLNGLFYSI